MDKILDMIAHWSPFGQGLFFFLILILVFATFNNVCRLGVVLVRGWPACNCQLPMAEEEEKPCSQ